MSGSEEIQRCGPAEIISGEAHIGPDGLAGHARSSKGEPFPSAPPNHHSNTSLAIFRFETGKLPGSTREHCR